jgi:hypothetical protein
MNHPHSDQRISNCEQREFAFPAQRYPHLVNAPVPPLDLHTSALNPTHHRHYPSSPPVIDGEVITSSIIPIPTRTNTSAPSSTRKRSLLRRAIDDPFWILMTLTGTLVLSIIGTAVYGAIQIMLAVAEWFSLNRTTILGGIVLIILLALCGGATAAKCAGIHCGGCKG